jgi:V/A-type H+-transporting ATPase subunit A
LITGQRVFDFLFPVAEGGTVAVPGGFGTGKTVIEQSLARFAHADVVIFVGCGERGNEIAEVLDEFPDLVDPRSGRPVMERTLLVVNTSNMPVVAREASVYAGLTAAEFYRDMGYHVAVMVDSLSRWAEALREIGGRLRELPGEEGYPTSLANRLGRLYERAGRVECTGSPQRQGAVSLIAAISPPGGDFSEPVTQASLRVAGALWALDPALAHQRHFPAVNWETSYSLYTTDTADWFAREVGEDWAELRASTLDLLAREVELKEIAELVGTESLQDEDRLTLELARIVREQVLAQSAVDPNDTYSPSGKTRRLAQLAKRLEERARAALARGAAVESLDFGRIRLAFAGLCAAPLADLAAAATRVEAAIDTLDAATAQEIPS